METSKKLKKIKLWNPKPLKIHAYVVVTRELTNPKRLKGTGKVHVHTQYTYCMNRADVRTAKNKAKNGAIVEIFKASHEPVEAYQKSN